MQVSLTLQNLTDTDEDSKLVLRRKRPKVDTLFSFLFSDASERRVWLPSTFGRFRLYRLSILKSFLLLGKERAPRKQAFKRKRRAVRDSFDDFDLF